MLVYGQLKLVKEKGLQFVFRFKSRIVPQLPWQGVPCCFTFAVKTPLTRGTLVHGSDSYSLPPDTECTDLPVVIYKIKRNILHIGHYQASRTYFDKNNSVHSKFHCADIFLLESQILHSHPYTRIDRLYCNTLYCDALLHSSDIWLLYHWMVKPLDMLSL